MNRQQEIELRLSAIASELEQDGADIDALTNEVNALNEELRGLRDVTEKRAKLRDMVAGGAGKQTRSFAPEQPKTYGADSAEYRSAFLKNLNGMEMNAEERAAFVHTTENTHNVLPTTMLTNIWNMIGENHAIMGDVTIYRTGTIIEVLKHTAIAQGDAKSIAENAANDDEQNTFVKVTLSGKDFTKHVDISYAMAKMSIDAFEAYLTREIADRLGAVMADDVIAKINEDMDSGNAVTAAKVDFAAVAQLFGKLKRVGAVTIYATRSTIYNHLVGMVDQTGRPVFQPNAQAGALGTLLGATIKEEDSVEDNAILVGDPKKVVYNMVQDIMIETDRDIKKHVITHSGYARGEGALIDPFGFAKMVVGG